MKKLMAILLTLGVSAVLIGCSDQGGGAPKKTEPPKAPAGGGGAEKTK